MRPVCLQMIFNSFYTPSSHNSIKDKLDLIEQPSIEKALLSLHVTTETHVLLWKNLEKYHAWSCQNVFDAPTFLLDNIFIRSGTNCIDK